MMADSRGESVLQSLAERIIQLDNIVEKEDVKCGRFGDITDTARFVQEMKNRNTLRKTQSDINLFMKYLTSVGDRRDPVDIHPKELDGLLARFFLNVRKSDGVSEYEPDTLKTYQSSLARYLGEKGYSVNILSDITFKHSRDVLSAKRKELKAKGKGNKEKKAEPLSSEEVNILYEKGQLGTASPCALINTVWWNNTVHFGLRSRQEHIDMRWGDVELRTTSTGEEYLQFSERATKTRTGVTNSTRPFQPKMFAVPDSDRCAVQAYKEYAKRRPQDFNENPDSPFYLSVNQNKSERWFSRQNMGKNKIGSLMKTMCENAGICGRKVNHSARKTTVTTLLHGGIAPTQIMQVTGHRNSNSINSYSSASLNQQKEMSTLLSALSAESPSTVTVPQVESSGHADVPDLDDGNEDMFFSNEIEDTLREIEGFEVIPPQPASVAQTISRQMSSSNTTTKSASAMSYLLSGAQIRGTVTINMNCTLPPVPEHPHVKRRRIRVIDSQSDSD